MPLNKSNKTSSPVKPNPIKSNRMDVFNLIKSVDDLAIDPISMMFYSKSGGGKTHLTCTALQVGTLCVISSEPYDKTLRKFPSAKVLSIPDVVKEAGSYESAFPMIVSSVKRRGKEFSSYSLDNISKLVYLVRREAIKADIKKAEDTARRFNSTPRTIDQWVPEQRHYQIATNIVCDFVWELRSVILSKGSHFFCTAWEKKDTVYASMEDDTGHDVFFPDLSPELTRLVTGEFDGSYRIETSIIVKRDESKDPKIKILKGENRSAMVLQRTLITIDGDSDVKSRYDLPYKIKNPTIPKLLAMISSGNTKIEEEDESSGIEVDSSSTLPELPSDSEVSEDVNLSEDNEENTTDTDKEA